MTINGVIYTTNKKSFVEKAIPEIKATVLRAKGVTFDGFKIVEIKLPKDVETRQDGVANRIDWNWFEDNYPADGVVRCLHISTREHNRLKLRHPNGGRLGGSYNRNLGDTSIDFFVVSARYAHFAHTFLHELSHGFSHWLGVPDQTHNYDYNLRQLPELYDRYDFTGWNVRKYLADLLKNFFNKPIARGLLHPVADFKDYVSQEYGVENKTWYPSTGHHIGTDYSCPKGTPVRCPFDGEVVTTGFSLELGHYCHFEYEYRGVVYVARFMHLSSAPNRGVFKRGDLLSLSGASGVITGPHLHVDVWKDSVRLDLINSGNWQDLTVNPETHFNQ